MVITAVKPIGISLAFSFALLLGACTDGGVPEHISTENSQAESKQSDGLPSDSSVSVDSQAVESTEEVAEHQGHSHAGDSGAAQQDTLSDDEIGEESFDYSQSSQSYADTGIDRLSFAKQQDDSGYITWQAPEEIDYKQADLLISGPNGQTIKRTFTAGEPISLDVPLPDGTYNWESVISPNVDPYVREEMRAVRESGNLEAEQALIARLRSEGALPSEEQSNANRQSGTFVVRDGVARPSLVDGPTDE